MNPIEQLRATGVILLGIILSPALAPVIGAYLTQRYGWESTFWLIFLLSTILTYAIFRLIPETNTNIQNQFNSITHYASIYWSLLTNKIFMSNVLFTSSTTAPFFGFLAISSYLFITQWGFTPEQYSYFFLLISASYLLGNIIMQILNNRHFSLDQIIKQGLIFSVAGIIILVSAVFFPIRLKIIIVISSMVLVRAANALISPTTQIKILNNFGHCSAQAIGLTFCINFTSNSLAIIIATSLNHKPLFGLITTSAGFIIFAIICYVFTITPKDRQH
jgi:DHA1 family bicyclomycin/chloramphenicol resistance-like MFS transporter